MTVPGYPQAKMEKTVLAFEIKCPVPKDYAIDAHYEIPHYYICQILSEMFTLKCDKLYFVFFSKYSSSFGRIGSRPFG